MNRFRCHFVPLLLMLPIVFICGKLLLTRINDYERGWPWLYINVHDWGTDTFSLPHLFADIALHTVVLIAAYCFIFSMCRRPGGWLQFSLRGLLLLVTAAAVVFGWRTYHVRQSQFEERLLERITSNTNLIHWRYRENFAPGWLVRFIPYENLDAFLRITDVYITLDDHQSDLFDELLDALPQFSHVTGVFIESGYRGDSQLPLLRMKEPAALRQIESISFLRAADDETLQVLPLLPELRSLMVSDCVITDAGLAKIAKCKMLEELQIVTPAAVTALGLANLRELRHLTQLSLFGLDVDEQMLTEILLFKSLKRLDLGNINVSEKLLKRLIELPNLEQLFLVTIKPTPSDETLQFLRSHINRVEL